MKKPPVILITGAAGFIGSSLVAELNNHGYSNLILADNFRKPEKNRYLIHKKFIQKTEASSLIQFLNEKNFEPDFVFHLGAKTAAKDDFFDKNLVYSQHLFQWCRENKIPFIYASTGSTYGLGELGFSDDEDLIHSLKPLVHPYAISKHEFDKWILKEGKSCPWAGLKLFNVFGPNEYYKGRSRSVAFKSFFEIKETGEIMLFDTSGNLQNPGEEKRDFIYVKDVLKICRWFLEEWICHKSSFPSGIFNVGTGVARSFNDVARSVFRAMNISEKIEYKTIPENILKSYPSITMADTTKLRKAGYREKMWTLEDAIDDLVKNYLIPEKIF